MLIDNGSTHNLINKSRIEVVHYFVHPVNNFHILIANGGMMKFGGHCDNVELQMRDYHLKIHMFSIDMGGCDIVFGVEWLRTLNPITMDFKELYMSFVKDSHTHTLQGIKANPLEIISSHHMEKLLKEGDCGIIDEFHAIQGLKTTPLEPHRAMEKILAHYSETFEIPIGLPPT